MLPQYLEGCFSALANLKGRMESSEVSPPARPGVSKSFGPWAASEFWNYPSGRSTIINIQLNSDPVSSNLAAPWSLQETGRKANSLPLYLCIASQHCCKPTGSQGWSLYATLDAPAGHKDCRFDIPRVDCGTLHITFLAGGSHLKKLQSQRCWEPF